MKKSDENASSEESEVEVFHRINRLKLKAGLGLNEGPGQLDTNAVNRANTVVLNAASLYPQEIKNILGHLNKEWTAIKGADPEKDNSKEIEKMSNTANQIKDLGMTFGYNLMGYFGESLRDYILKTDLTKPEHLIIVQAHIDVMGVAFRENLKDDDGGSMAEELKRMVRAAIEKYHK